jgi:choline kinase
MKAVIAAAGRGSRLGALTRYRPKGLLSINGESILARQIRILKLYGINDIAIVTGYQPENFIERFKDKVTFFCNPDYLITTSTSSLYKAIDFMDEDIVTLCSDVVFSEESLDGLLNNPHRYCLLIDNKYCDQEAVKIQISGNKVINGGKHLSSKESFGEWVYISRIRKSGLPAFKDTLLECASKKLGSIQIFIKLIEKGCDVHYELINHEWAEVDYVKDYIEAKRIFKAGNIPLKD